MNATNHSAVRAKLVAHGRGLLNDGSISLTRAPRTPFAWSVRNVLHYAIIPGALLLPWILAIPFLVPLPPLFFWVVVPFGVLDAVLFLVLDPLPPGRVRRHRRSSACGSCRCSSCFRC